MMRVLMLSDLKMYMLVCRTKTVKLPLDNTRGQSFVADLDLSRIAKERERVKARYSY